MKLLIDSADFNYNEQMPVKNVISESLGKGKKYYIQGIFAQSEKENRNGRTFKCKRCGFQINADLNASRNIATFSRADRSRLPVNQPIVAS